jgi:photosystem II stability/assembly factor-like uncharacterized protein
VYSFVIDPLSPATLYAGTNGGGVFMSTDAGESWSGFNNGLTNTAIHSMAIHPTTPDSLFAGTAGAGVFATVPMVTQYQIYLPVAIK